MGQHIRLFNRTLFGSVPGETLPGALSIAGNLPDYTLGESYEGRLTIVNALGKCTVAVLSSSLPDGAVVYVDNFTKEVVVAWPAYSETETEIVFNGDFEEGSRGWYTPFPWKITNTGDAESGVYSAEFQPGFVGEAVMVGAAVPASPELTIGVELRVQQGASSANNIGAQCGLRWLDSAGNTIADVFGTAVTSGSNGQWHSSFLTATAPAGTAKVRPLIKGARIRENKPLWVDDFVWDHPATAGSNEPAEVYTLSLRVTDSTGRTADWSGEIREEGTYDPEYSSVVSLMHMNGSSFVDDTGLLWSSAGAVPSSVQAKFGQSLACPASPAQPEFLRTGTLTTDDRFNFGNGDFTIEGWAYLTGSLPAAGNYRFLYTYDDTNSGAQRGWRLLVDGDQGGKLRFGCNTGPATAVAVTDPNTFPLNSWQYIKVVRNGNTLSLYRGSDSSNYGLIATTTLSAAIQAQDTRAYIGMGQTAGNSVSNWRWVGYLDEWRVTKGVARLGAIPDAPFPGAAT